MGSSEAIQVDIAGFYLRLDDVHVDDLTPEGDDFAHEAPGDGADDVEFVPTDLAYIHHPNLITAADGAADDAGGQFHVDVEADASLAALWLERVRTAGVG